MKAPLREQLRAQSLPEDELTDTEQQLLRQVLDQDLQAQWAKALAEKGVHRQAPGNLIRRLRPWLAAAAVILLLGFGIWWFMNTSQLDPLQMAALEVEQLSVPGGGFQRGDVQTDPQRSASYTAYENGKFQDALDGITPLLADSAAEASDHILAGLCNLKLPQPDYSTAIRHFLDARNSDSGNYADDLHWYLGLAYTLSGNKANALAELNAVANSPQSRNFRKAAELIKALE